MLFDAPEPTVSVGGRVSTTVAPQALHFMNNPQVRNAALAMAQKLKTFSNEEAVVQAYRLALGRIPDAEELKKASGFLEQQKTNYPADTGQNLALADFCQVLFSLNEFVYVE